MRPFAWRLRLKTAELGPANMAKRERLLTTISYSASLVFSGTFGELHRTIWNAWIIGDERKTTASISAIPALA